MSFDKAFEILIGHEGGYSMNPNDPGGETKFGVSKRQYPNLDIANLTLDDAKAIYRRDYWNPVRADELPYPVALAVFDMAVNSGVMASVMCLQQAVGAKQDGRIGPLTIAAVAKANTRDLLVDFFAFRNVRNSEIKHWSHFKLGWSRRLFSLILQTQGV
jgi:lysozyme family protein